MWRFQKLQNLGMRIRTNLRLGSEQGGRSLEGWPNTAARLAGWRRVTQQDVTLYVSDGPYCLPLSVRLLSCKRLAFPAAAAAGLLLNVHK
jgi:hypothetical protein